MAILVEIELNCGVTLRRWFDDLDIESAEALRDRFNSDTYIDGTPKSYRALSRATLYFDISEEAKKAS